MCVYSNVIEKRIRTSGKFTFFLGVKFFSLFSFEIQMLISSEKEKIKVFLVNRLETKEMWQKKKIKSNVKQKKTNNSKKSGK